MNEDTQYASFWKRLAAWIVDALLIGAIIFLARISFATAISLIHLKLAGGKATMISLVVGVSIAILYHTVFESSVLQSTPGKMLLGLAVTDRDGRRISFKRALGRHFGKYISGALLCIGYAMCAFTAQKQCLHDRMAGCFVVKKAKIINLKE